MARQVFFAIVLLFGTIFYTCDGLGQIDKLKSMYIKLILECAKIYELDVEELQQVRNKVLPDTENARCLFACVYKKSGMMNEKGELSVEGIQTLTEKHFADDPEKLARSKEVADICKSVNDVPVTDGDAGCERAALMFNCTLENSPELKLF